ncbi:MAG: membrane integrity-associated transporter subunit PqiC [Zoogloeaceae bacterium]|nr:membrane integrity-associated transporter subunit PqiC [Zoogloeaceae bacterium]
MANRFLIPTLAAALLTSACSSIGPAPAEIFYRLPPAQVEAGEKKLPGVLLIDAWRAGDLHGSSNLLHSEDTAGISVQPYHYDLWVDRPTKLIADFAQDWLGKRGVADLVLNEESGMDGAWRLIGEIRRFEQLNGGAPAVVVGLDLRLIDLNDRDATPRGGYYEATAPIADDKPLTAIQGYRAALEQVLTRFTEGL